MRTSILTVLAIDMIIATAGFVSNSSTSSELNSQRTDTDKIVLAIVESLKEDAKKIHQSLTAALNTRAVRQQY